jgi:hypothetical protein
MTRRDLISMAAAAIGLTALVRFIDRKSVV